MKKALIFICCCLAGLSVMAQKDNAKKPPVLKTQVDSVSYAYGVSLASSLKRQLSADLNTNLVMEGLNSAVKGDSLAISPDEASKLYSDYNRKAQAKAAEQNRLAGEQNKAAGQKFLEENKKRKEVITTASGLQYEVLKKGPGGPQPKAESKVEVHYHGTLLDGTVFDSSVQRGKTATFGLNQVIKGWTEGVQLMSPGDKFKFYLPYDLAYGDRGSGPKIKPFAALIFEVELFKIVE